MRPEALPKRLMLKEEKGQKQDKTCLEVYLD